jgi:hypothetical protein
VPLFLFLTVEKLTHIVKSTSLFTADTLTLFRRAANAPTVISALSDGLGGSHHGKGCGQEDGETHDEWMNG